MVSLGFTIPKACGFEAATQLQKNKLQIHTQQTTHSFNH